MSDLRLNFIQISNGEFIVENYILWFYDKVNWSNFGKNLAPSL